MKKSRILAKIVTDGRCGWGGSGSFVSVESTSSQETIKVHILKTSRHPRYGRQVDTLTRTLKPLQKRGLSCNVGPTIGGWRSEFKIITRARR